MPRPWVGALRRDLGPAIYAMVLIPFGVYLASYGPWFASETGINRHEVGQSIGPGGFLPDAIRSLWHYTYGAYRFHAGLTNADGNHHPWESKPWTWPMSLRPVLYAIDQENVPGCGAQSCVKAVMLVGTPAMWFIAVPVLGWALWRAFVKKDWRYGAVLVGYGAGFLPWFADIDRQMYFFYAATMAPFLVMAIAMILRRHLAPAESERRATNARDDRGQLLCGVGDHELRLDVSDPDRLTDLAVDVELGDLAPQLEVDFALRGCSIRLFTALCAISALRRRIVGSGHQHHGMGEVFKGSEALARGGITRARL